MRILIAPDKFRGTFTARQVCEHLAAGVADLLPEALVETVPMADGGEGTLDVVLSALGGTRVRMTARDSAGTPVESEYGVTRDGTAVLEAARFCGLGREAAGSRDPMRASSRGLGEAIADALESGLRRFLIGLGGTATVDGGAGMARALGFRLLDASGRDLDGGGGDQERIARIDATTAHQDLEAARFTILCDVANPLLGPQGAARVFGPQKGAAPSQVARLEAGLAALAGALAALRSVPLETLVSAPGAGAGGGLGAGASAFLGGRRVPGAEFLFDLLGLAARLERCDLIVTGEGSFDSQSFGGKVVGTLLRKAAAAGRPVLVVAGRWDGTASAETQPPLEIITAQSVGSPGGPMDEPGLREAGRRVAVVARRVANGRIDS
ncbi:MAG TPA: glycerate kinase [Candidatus Polarisedimenticolia bacterium]|nr:glycerate kinase [Candidatus Polarisedimenticolia bacterium]